MGVVLLVIVLACFCAKKRKGDAKRGTSGPGVSQAVAQAARELADNSTIVGVSEAASLICLLVDLVQGTRDDASAVDRNLKRCQSMVDMLRTAATVLGKVRCGVGGKSGL